MIYTIIISISCTNGRLRKVNKNTDGLTSFVALKEEIKETAFLEANVSAQEKLRLELALKEMFLAQLNGRNKKRYTLDGKLCASAFVQDKKTYYDCTQSRTPDGKNDKKEWCYIDVHSRKKKDWDFCKPTIDYDKVRERNQAELGSITTEARKIISEVTPLTQKGQNMLDDIKNIRDGHADLDNKLDLMMKSLGSMHKNLEFLYVTRDKWVEEEKKAIAFSQKLKALLAARDKAASQKKKIEYYPTDPLSLKKEMIDTNAVINPILQRREKSEEVNCDGLDGYEEEGSGTGISGDYFDNEGWIGSSVSRDDEEIDFNWVATSPIEGVNSNNFSIKWEGFIKAPYSGNFKFYVSTSDGAILNVNDKLIISHNMHTAKEENVPRTSTWLNNEIRKIENPTKNHIKSESKDVNLIGGTKYKLVLSFYHSIHNLLHDEFKAFIKLSWSSADFDEVVIPKASLFKTNKFPPLKVTELNLEDISMARYDEHDLVFKNSDRYILADIPDILSGGLRLKFDVRYKKSDLAFRVNTPINVYIGVLSHYPNPLPSMFEYLGHQTSILEIDPKKITKKSTKVFGVNSGIFNLYKKRFVPGKVKINFKKIGANKKGIPMIVFFAPDTSGSSPISCGGKEQLLSRPGSKSFKNCGMSSAYNNMKCVDGLNGKMKDEFGSMWWSRGEGVGAWFKVSFKGVYMVTRFEYKPRSNDSERNKVLQLLFSDGSKQEFTIPNNDKVQEIRLEKHQTQFVIVRIKEVYGTINNGGAFNFYGIECKNLNSKGSKKEANGLLKAAGKDPKTIPPLFKVDIKKVISIGCRDSFANSKKLAHVHTSLGSHINIRCFESCAESPFMIYGNNKYTKDSAICKAAFHNKKIQPNGGIIQVNFSEGLSKYEESETNGVKSYPRTFSELTLTFETAKEEDDIILKEGTKVDLRNKKGPGFLSATITKIIEKKSGQQVVIGIDGQNEKITMTYPDKANIFPCGDHIKGKDCKKSRKSVNLQRMVQIRFAPKIWKKTGDYLIDQGGVYGSTGKPFGWTKDISTRFKLHEGKSPKFPLIETMVHFPPSPLSKYCKKEIPDTICDTVDWSVKAGDGTFVIKLYFGDPVINSKIDLSINGTKVFGKVVKKEKQIIIEKNIESIDGFITISSKCDSDCDYSMSKLSAIEIVPFVIKIEDPPTPKPEKKDRCGGSIEGGKCESGNDVVHCLFDDPSNDRAKQCTGENMMMEVPKKSNCINQIGKFKCVKRFYKDPTECTHFCPKKCVKNQCS